MTSEQPGQVEGAGEMNEQKPVDIEAIRARANAATPGPWGTGHNDTYVSGPLTDGEWDWIIGDIPVDDGQEQEDYRGHRIKENCIFVANARQDVPALCDDVEALRYTLTVLRIMAVQAQSIGKDINPSKILEELNREHR